MDPEEDKKTLVKDEIQSDIFADIGALDIDDVEKGVLLARMIDLVESRSLVKIVENLNDDKQKELEVLLDAEDVEPIEKFLEENVPEFEQIFIDEAKRLRQELKIELGE